jgi:hypothetical protein
MYGDFLFCPAKPAVNRLFRGPKDTGHLLVAHLVVEPQKDDFSKVLRQLLEDFGQNSILLVALTIALALTVNLGWLSLPLDVLQHVFGHVPADCCNPRAEPLRLVQPRKLPARCGKRLLSGIFGRMMIQQNRIRHSYKRRVIPPAKLAEALLIGLQSTLNENLVLKVFHCQISYSTEPLCTSINMSQSGAKIGA